MILSRRKNERRNILGRSLRVVCGDDGLETVDGGLNTMDVMVERSHQNAV